MPLNFTARQYGYIPLTFEQDYIQYFINLCNRRKNKWSLFYYTADRMWKGKKYRPKVEIQYINFRRVEPTARPIRIKLVRCSEKYALIEAEKDRSGYLLRKGKPDRHTCGTIFHIDARFNQNKKVPVLSRSVTISEEHLLEINRLDISK